MATRCSVFCTRSRRDCRAVTANDPRLIESRNRLVSSRCWATALIEALDRHRGKGQQRITVEHVNVHAGGGDRRCRHPGGVRSNQKSEEQTSATMDRASRCGARTRSGRPCQLPAVRGVQCTVARLEAPPLSATRMGATLRLQRWDLSACRHCRMPLRRFAKDNIRARVDRDRRRSLTFCAREKI